MAPGRPLIQDRASQICPDRSAVTTRQLFLVTQTFPEPSKDLVGWGLSPLPNPSVPFGPAEFGPDQLTNCHRRIPCLDARGNPPRPRSGKRTRRLGLITKNAQSLPLDETPTGVWPPEMSRTRRNIEGPEAPQFPHLGRGAAPEPLPAPQGHPPTRPALGGPGGVVTLQPLLESIHLHRPLSSRTQRTLPCC